MYSPSRSPLPPPSFRIDQFELEVQGTLKSFLQHHSSKASILWCSSFFMVQLSHLYMTTGKTIALTRWTFVSKAMSLVCNMLSRRNARIYLVLEAFLQLLCSVYTIRDNNQKTDSSQDDTKITQAKHSDSQVEKQSVEEVGKIIQFWIFSRYAKYIFPNGLDMGYEKVKNNS